VSAGPPLLECERVTVRVAGRALVRDLDLAVAGGQIWCLLGPNGAGKTSLLHTLTGLVPAAAGTVRLAGRPVADWPLGKAAGQRSFMPQAIHDAFSASAIGLVMMGRYPHLPRWQWEGEGERAAALAALGAMDIAALADRDVLTLSGGERQRVALAATLAQDAPLMLLDEPLTHLDLHHQVMVLRHLQGRAAAQHGGVVFSIHDLNLAARFASHALVLMPGGGVTQGAVAEVMSEAVLCEAFGHRVRRVDAAGQMLFVPE
jgi:iron complex transport system ATP-binding protein